MNVKKNKKMNANVKSSKFYVLLRPDTGEFFVEQTQTLFGSVTKWGKHPNSAQSWKNIDVARACAMGISGRKAIEIHVCSVVDSGEQYQVETESTFFAPSVPN